MPDTAPTYATLDDWIAREAIPFSLAQPQAAAAADALMGALDGDVELLGFGEALHGGEEILALRNQLFQRLVEAHGYRAVALELGLPWSRLVNEYVAGRGPGSYDAIRDAGFTHGFGRLDANRELVEWMRAYNAGSSHRVKLHFYGFDMPAIAASSASPRQGLQVVREYLAAFDPGQAQAYGQRIDELAGEDARWENPMAWRDDSEAPGLLADASALRLVIEDLIASLRTRRPALIAASGAERFQEALHYAAMAREHLNFFVVLAGPSSFAGSLAIRDALMADNLAYILARERGRGKVLAFAHNTHLQRGLAHMPVGPEVYTWWPAGSQLHHMLGARYAVIGSALGVSEANGVGQAEPGTLEARLVAAPGPARFIPTRLGRGLPAAEIAGAPLRSRSARNPSYTTPLSPQSFTDFDWWAVLDSATYSRGGRPLP